MWGSVVGISRHLQLLHCLHRKVDVIREAWITWSWKWRHYEPSKRWEVPKIRRYVPEGLNCLKCCIRHWNVFCYPTLIIRLVCKFSTMIYVYIYIYIYIYICTLQFKADPRFMEILWTPDLLLWYNALRIMRSSPQELSLEPAEPQIIFRYLSCGL
jgi:hypothetical protein